MRGDILISNFNNSENLQGTGTTIVQMTPPGSLSLFAQINPATLPGPCPGGVGLTTALAILPGGYVVVGSLPTTNGIAATAQAGCLIVLDSTGHVVKTISGAPINGPWDMTAVDRGATQPRCSSRTSSTAPSPRAKRRSTAARSCASRC